MALLAYNLTGASVILAAGNPQRTLPPSPSPPTLGPATNVTSELVGLSNSEWAAIQAQITGGSIRLIWSTTPEYSTDGVVIANGTAVATDEYHVDGIQGDDTIADGSPIRPYKTIQACLNAINVPVDKQDACRQIRVFLHSTHSSGGQITATQSNDFDGIYQENLWVPPRKITFYGPGIKIGNIAETSGYGNILQEISTARRFGASSSELRHAMTFKGLTNSRDTHQRIRNGIHVGGNTRIAVLKRTIFSIQGDPTGPNDRVTIVLSPGQSPYLPSVSQYAYMAVTTQDSTDTVTYSSPLPIPNTVGTQGVFFKTLVGTTGISVDTNYHVVNATPTTFQLSLVAGGAAIPLTNDGTGTIMSRPGTLPFEPLVRILVSGTTNYNASYDIIEQISPTQFIAKRITGTNTSSALETPVSASFFETDSTGGSGQTTHSIFFEDCYQQGTFSSDDGSNNGAATSAGTCVLYARNCRFFSGFFLPSGSGGLPQRVENCQIDFGANKSATVTSYSRTTNVVTVLASSTYAWASGMVVTITNSTSGGGQNIDGTWVLTGGNYGTFTFTQTGGDYASQTPLVSSSIATYSNFGAPNNINGCSFTGNAVIAGWTYSTDDMGWVGNRFNSGVRLHVTATGAAPQPKMDDYTTSLLMSNVTWALPVTFTDAGDLVTRTNHALWNGALVRFTNITTTTGISTGTDYYVISATTNTFQLASTPGGSALPLTTNGTGIMDVAPNQMPGYVDMLTPNQIVAQQQFIQTSSVTIANLNTENGLTGAGIGQLNFPANFFSVERTLRITGSGYFGAVLAPTIRIRVKLGAVTLLDTTAVTSLNETNKQFTLDAEITCRTTGGSGTFFAQGRFIQYGTAANLYAQMTNTGTVVVNTTIAQALTVTAQWGTADAANTITLTNLLVTA